MEVEAFDDGVLLKRVVAEGETVPVNAVCAYVGEPGEAIPDAAPAAAPPRGRRRPPAAAVAGRAAVRQPRQWPAVAVPPRQPRRPAPGDGRLRISPRASRLAADAGIDPRTIAGTGPDGRIVERDVRAALEAAAAAPAGGIAGRGARVGLASRARGARLRTPRTRRRAR